MTAHIEDHPTNDDSATVAGTVEQVKVALVVGSVRPGRTADALLPWLRGALDRPWLDLDVVDLADHDLTDRGLGHDSGPSPVSHRLARADAFVLLVPEYNHSFPGSVKSAIDHHHDEWAFKPVTFVAYGAASGGLRAVEHLRQVFPEVSALTTRNVVSLPAPWDHLDDRGRYAAPDAVKGALEATLAELRWWATTLRAGRRTTAVPR